jgi:hypothetical protein
MVRGWRIIFLFPQKLIVALGGFFLRFAGCAQAFGRKV